MRKRLTTAAMRNKLAREVAAMYQAERMSMCWEDFYAHVAPTAEKLCQDAYDNGKYKFSKSADRYVFNGAMTIAYDAFDTGCYYAYYMGRVN